MFLELSDIPFCVNFVFLFYLFIFILCLSNVVFFLLEGGELCDCF